MAGWSSMLSDDQSAGECAKLKGVKPIEGIVELSNGDVQCLFYRVLAGFLNVCCDGVSRPLPPMVGEDKHYVDLFRLFMCVREKGGFEAVQGKHLWESVAEECKLRLGNFGELVSVYEKYLLELEKRARGFFEGESTGDLRKCLTKLEVEFSGMVSYDGKMDLAVLDAKEGVYPSGEVECKLNTEDYGELFDSVEVQKDVRKVGGGKENSGGGEIFVSHKGRRVSLVGKVDKEKEVVSLYPVQVEEINSRKRKRDSWVGMLSWLNRVAKNPCDPRVGWLPKVSEWKAYGNEYWKQILLFRESVFVKLQTERSLDQSHWQLFRRMCPSMYDEQTCVSPRTSDGEETSEISYLSCADLCYKDPDQEVPVGLSHQAVIPEFSGLVSESDSKWLGTRVWPLEKVNPRFIIERDPIGRGRQDNCGCQFAGSVECVRFHVAEKRLKVIRELGSAFYQWKFDKMGEEVRHSWTKEEENIFQGIVETNLSKNHPFWDEIYQKFSSKNRESLVSYYYNVFVRDRRAYQNRHTPMEIDSDDDAKLV